MDRTERAIEAQLASFREAIEAASAGDLPQLPELEPLWQRIAAAIGGTLLGLLGLAAVAGLLAVLAFFAHLGWEIAGGVGW